MANIGNLSVLVKANANDFSSTLEKAAKSIDRFGSTAARLSGAVAAPLEAIAAKLKNILTSIPLVGGAFAALPDTGEGFVKWLREGMADIVDLTKAAQRLNVTTEALAGLQLAAGSSSEAMEKGLFKLSRQLGDAATGGREAGQVFEGLGLDAAQLAALPLDKTLGLLSDKFRSLASPAERAYLAYQLFGKSGYELLPVLARGSAALDAAAEKAKSFGASFSSIDAAGVIRAQRAFAQIDLALKGIQRQAAIAFAPVLGAVAEKFSSIFEGQNGFRDFWQQAAEWAAKAGAVVLEWLDAAIVKLKELGGWLQEMIGDYRSLKDLPGNIAVNLGNSFLPFGSLNALTQLGTQGQQWAGETSKQGGIFGDLIASLKNLPAYAAGAAAKMGVFGEGTLDASRQAAEAARQAEQLSNKVVELTTDLQAQVETFGMSAEDAKLWKLQQEGATEAMLNQARGLSLALDSLKEFQKAQEDMAKKAEEVWKDSASPLEKFGEKLYELRDLFAAGLIDADRYALGVAKALEAVAPKEHDYTAKAPAGLERGSAAAISAVTMASRGDGGQLDVQRRIEQLLQQQSLADEATLQEARQIRQILDQLVPRDIP